MAFGNLITNGTGTLSGASIGASNAIPINAGTGVTVAVGDLVVALMCQQTGLTASGASDVLGNTYTAQNVGTTSTVSGRLFYSRVTNPGTLTSVTIAATSSTNDYACCAAVFSGPFTTSPVDKTPANATGDITTPYSCPATGTLAQADELVIGWSANNANATWGATSPFAIAVQAPRANAHAAICYDLVAVTTDSTPSFTGTAPAQNVAGTITFKAADAVTVDSASLTFSAQAIVVLDAEVVTAGALTLSGETVAVVDVEPITAGSLAIAGSDITITEAGGTVEPAFQADAFQNDAFQVEEAVPDTVTVDAASLTFSGSNITEVDLIGITAADLSLTGSTILEADGVIITAATLALSGSAITEAETVGITAATLSLSPQTIGVVDSEAITAAALSLSGSAITEAETVGITAGSLAFSGASISELETVGITAAALSLTGQDITVTDVSIDIIPVTSTALTLSGSSITEAETVGITAASLSLTPASIGVVDVEPITAASLTLAGQSITEAERIGITAGALSFTPASITETESVGITAASLSLVGQDITVSDIAAELVPIVSAALILEGQDIGTTDVIIAEPIAPSPGGVGGRPLYRRAKLKRKRKREELEEFLEYVHDLPPPAVEEAPSSVSGMPSLVDTLPPLPVLPSRRIIADEDEDEIALLLMEIS